MGCTAGVLASMTEDLRAHALAGVPGKACPDMPPWVLCHDKEFSVAIGFSCFVLRHSLGVATGPGF